MLLVINHIVQPVKGTSGAAYSEGARVFWSQGNPYRDEIQSSPFHYSPFFAFLYRPLSLLNDSLHRGLWFFFNIIFFWYAISHWFLFDVKNKNFFYWLGWIGASMELDGAIRYHQINPFIIATILLGIFYFRQRAWLASAWWLTLGTNIKIIPGIFLFPLLLPFHFSFLVLIFSFFSLFFLLPALVVGWAHNLTLHAFHITSLLADIPTRHMSDIRSAFEYLGYPLLAAWIWRGVAFFGGILFCAMRFFDIINFRNLDWYAWISLGFSIILLLSPMTESPTFVFIAFPYLYLAHKKEWWIQGTFLMSLYFISLVFNSIFPVFLTFGLRSFGFWSSKAIGTLLIFFILYISIIKNYALVSSKDSKKDHMS